VALKSLTIPLFIKQMLKRGWKAELWNKFFFSRINEEKTMPNILSDVLSGKVVQPVHIVNYTRGICAAHISMEGAGWQNLASCLGAGFFFQEGQRLSFQPSCTETAAGYGHVTALGQWNISGGATLCHARLGLCDPPNPGQPQWRSHRWKKPGFLDHFIEESCPSIRDTHLELQVRRPTSELWEGH